MFSGELIVSNRVLGTTEILLLDHTGCGFTTFTDDEMNAKLSASTGNASPAPMRFFSYKDPEENTASRSRKSGHIPGLPKTSPCAASFSTWTPGDYARSNYLNTSAPPDS
jgi:carbonic anhydrase